MKWFYASWSELPHNHVLKSRSVDDIGALGEEPWNVPHSWDAPVFSTSGVGPLVDFWANADGQRLCSTGLRGLIDEFVELGRATEVVWLPAWVESAGVRQEYWLLGFSKKSDVLHESSMFHETSIGRRVLRPVVDASGKASGLDISTVWAGPPGLVVSERFRSEFDRLGLTGMEFEDCAVA